MSMWSTLLILFIIIVLGIYFRKGLSAVRLGSNEYVETLSYDLNRRSKVYTTKVLNAVQEDIRTNKINPNAMEELRKLMNN